MLKTGNQAPIVSELLDWQTKIPRDIQNIWDRKQEHHDYSAFFCHIVTFLACLKSLLLLDKCSTTLFDLQKFDLLKPFQKLVTCFKKWLLSAKFAVALSHQDPRNLRVAIAKIEMRIKPRAMRHSIQNSQCTDKTERKVQPQYHSAGSSTLFGNIHSWSL